MSYPEDKDPLTGKGRRHTAASLAVLGLSKAVIVDDEEEIPQIITPIILPSFVERKIKEGEILMAGDVVTWTSEKTEKQKKYIGVVSAYNNDNIYTILILEPHTLLGRAGRINIDRLSIIENKGKQIESGEPVIIYWADDRRLKMHVGTGVVKRTEKVPTNGNFPDLINYEVVLSEEVPAFSEIFKKGSIVTVYEYIGNDFENAITKNQKLIPTNRFRTNRIWSVYNPMRLDFDKSFDSKNEIVWEYKANDYVSLKVKASKHGVNWVVTYRWELFDSEKRISGEDEVSVKAYDNRDYAIKMAKELMDKASLDDYKVFKKNITDDYAMYLKKKQYVR